jgi:hypothetical protein
MAEDSLVRERLGIRLGAICGPALTGSTVSWAVHAVYFGKMAWQRPALPTDLPLLWLATIAFGVLYVGIRKLSTLKAAMLSTLGGTSLGLAHYSTLFFLSNPKMSSGVYDETLGMMFTMSLVTVALSSVLWVPAVWLSWNRHSNRARDLQRAFNHA